MIRGLDVGVRRTVAAKLRERGLPEDVAAQLTESRLSDAVEFFSKQLGLRETRGQGTEMAIDDAFEDLSQWAARLAEVHQGGASPATQIET